MANLRYAFVLFVLQLQAWFSSLAFSSKSEIKFLPGFQGPLPFPFETGYIGVGESDEVQLFYYFLKSERNPVEDPLILWLTGGPGCSDISGLVLEIGPLKFKVEQYNGSLPTFELNPCSWTKTSSIILVDSPVGTGFSYATKSLTDTIGDFIQVRHLLQFFRKWMNDHSEFWSNPIYIGGESYCGITIPVLVQEILNENDQGTLPLVNFQGYILGNPRTDASLEASYKIPFAHGMGLISDELFESVKRNCEGEYVNIHPSNVECLKDFDAYQECISGIKADHILEPLCNMSSLTPHDMFRRRSLYKRSKLLLHPDPRLHCREYAYLLTDYWANDRKVRQALRIREGSIGRWKRCHWDIPFNKEISNSFQYHVNLSRKGYRSLIYSGDHDLQVPFLSTQAWIRALNYSILEDWRPWHIEGQVAGFTRTYSNRMTFATVKGGGHIAPEYKPKESFTMFYRWINAKPL